MSDCRTDAATSVLAAGGPGAGGIAGYAEDAVIGRCINSAAVSGGDQVPFAGIGGIAGCLTGTVSHCLNAGPVSRTGDFEQDPSENSGTAGITGCAGGTVICCGNAGAVTSSTDCSGIVSAVSDELTVSFCYNASDLSFHTDFTDVSYPIAPGTAVCENNVGIDGAITQSDLTDTETFDGWDFGTVWYEPGDYHGYAYPVLRDCNFHTLQITQTEPTCTHSGGREIRCVDPLCGFTLHEETAQPLEHDWVVSSRTEATCTREGEITYVCSRCQTEKPEKDVIPVDPGNHTDADGDKLCDDCGAKAYTPIPVSAEYTLAYDTGESEFIPNTIAEERYFPEIGLDLPAGARLAKRAGRLFDGWYDNAGFEGDALTEIPAGSTGDITLYAKYVDCDHAASTAQPTCTESAVCTVCGGTIPCVPHQYGEPTLVWADDHKSAECVYVCGVCTGTKTEPFEPAADLEAYKAEMADAADKLGKENDSEACAALIENAKTAIAAILYDETKTLDENKYAVDELIAQLAKDLKAQRKADRQEELRHQPCSLCGKHHTGSIFENLIGIIHGLIWIMRQVALIAV